MAKKKKKATNSKKVKLGSISHVTGDSGAAVVTWSWSKKNTKEYSYKWQYRAGAIWYDGDSGTTTRKLSTYSYPDISEQIRVCVKPISTTHKVGKKGKQKEKHYWTGQWSSWKAMAVTDTVLVDDLPSPTYEYKNGTINIKISNINTSRINIKYNKQKNRRYWNTSHVQIELSTGKGSQKSVVVAVTEYGSNTEANRKGYIDYTYSCQAGKTYSVRCRGLRQHDAKNNGKWEFGKWSNEYSDIITGPPTIKKFKSATVEKVSSNSYSAHLTWAAAATATSYTIQYAVKPTPGGFDIGETDWGYDKTLSNSYLTKYFNRDDCPKQEATVSSVDNKPPATSIYIPLNDGLYGNTVYFRIKATNSAGDSAWSSEFKSVTTGEKPEAPTTWSSTTSCKVGEPLYLYWLFNSKDGSQQSRYEIKIYVSDGDTTKTITISGTDQRPIDYREESMYITLDTSSTISTVASKTETRDGYNIVYSITANDGSVNLANGVTATWQARSLGVVTDDDFWSDWSTLRELKIYAEPKANMTTNLEEPAGDSDVTKLLSFPLTVTTAYTPANQTPIGYNVSIIANETYDKDIDDLGNSMVVTEGQVLYQRYFTSVDSEWESSNINLTILPTMVNLYNGIMYTLQCQISTDAGLNTTEEIVFMTDYNEDEEGMPRPSATLEPDEDSYSMTILPECRYGLYSLIKVEQSNGKWVRTSTQLDPQFNEAEYVDDNGNQYTVEDTNEPIYVGNPTETSTVKNYYIYEEYEDADTAEQTYYPCTLAVYRQNYDGSYTLIQDGLVNGAELNSVIDEHPSLDGATYRIVATSTSTGQITYDDISSDDMIVPSIIIQWDENVQSGRTNALDEESSVYTGSLLKLDYNIDVNNNVNQEVELVNYIGRTQPVSYYGTHLDETATWQAVIPYDDTDTIDKLRRLAAWMGDVYVREPSGIGYWANVSVSLPINHMSMTIPVSIDIKRVEGGV